MNSHTRRLNGSFRQFDAKTRVLMVLKCFKRDVEPDAAIWSTMRAEERTEFKRLVGLVRAATRLGPYFVLLRSLVAELEQRYRVLETRRGLGQDIRALGGYIRRFTKEPVTESGYLRRGRELRAALVPVRELAESAIERYSGWTDDDYDEDAGERVLRDGSWERALDEVECELIKLFRDGSLTGEENHEGVQIHSGSFHDWLGDPLPVLSEGGHEYEVLPDSLADEVASQQRIRRMVEELITGAPARDDLPLDLEGEPPDVSEKTVHAALERAEVIDIRNEIQARWLELRAFEIVAGRLAAKEFYGEDVLRVEHRDVLQDVRERLLALRENLQAYAGTITFSEPQASDITRLEKATHLVSAPTTSGPAQASRARREARPARRARPRAWP